MRVMRPVPYRSTGSDLVSVNPDSNREDTTDSKSFSGDDSCSHAGVNTCILVRDAVSHDTFVSTGTMCRQPRCFKLAMVLDRSAP